MITNFTAGFDSAYSVVIESDGGILAGGQVAGRGGRFGLALYTAGGSLDPSFGGDGRVMTNFGPGFDAVGDVALDAGGRIVVAGVAEINNDWRFALARYHADGSLDSTFGRGGKVVTNFTRGADFAYGVAIQLDGKIVAAGHAGGKGGRVALARYKPNGKLDATFGGDGRVMTDFTRGDDRADIVLVDAGSNIVVVGTANYFRDRARFALARYTANGKLDPSFSGDGKATTNFTSGFDAAFGAALQDDGAIVAGGQAGSNIGLARYLADGTLDTSFSGDGKVTTSVGSGAEYVDEIMLQEDGKIVAAGTANLHGPDSSFALVRFNSDGTRDLTFDEDGAVTTNLTSRRDGAYSVAIQPLDGKIVAAGFAGGGGRRFALVRYLGS